MNTKNGLKKILFTLTLLVVIGANSFANSTDWGNAQWIWQQADGPSNTWMSFRKTVTIDELPSTVEAHIAVDSKYWLWINGEMVVFEGGFSRGPSQAGTWNRTAGITPTNSWSETIDIKPYLKTGENTIAILVWYWGRETHKGTHIDSGKGGLLFSTQIGNQHIVSNSSWKAIQHPGYDNSIQPASDNLVQYPVKYDARTTMNDWTATAWYTNNYNDTSWTNAIEKGAAGVAPWYDLIENYVPPLINHGLQDYENNAALGLPFVSTGQVYRCKLPFNKQITPYLEIEAEAGKVITITTDNRLNKITGTYTTKGGVQSFESLSWMSGHEVLYTIPAGVTVRALKYRWMSVGEMAGSYEVSDPFYQKLWEMGDKTLSVCARDNFMDTPDRERALWIGDVADQTGYLFYSMDNSGHQLLKKAILQTMYFSENKVIGALGPLRVRELVGQSLQFIAQTVWPYYFNTGDKETLEIAYPYVYDYLALFPMQSNGLPEYRRSKSPDSWDWLDWGVSNTIDKQPIQPAYYYMALVAAKQMAETLGKTEHIAFYTERINSIKENYDKVFWKDGFYSSNAGVFKDDRANALAIVSGVAKPENYAAIVKNVLVPNKFSSPHFEWVAEEAMFIAGKYKESLERMKEQYASQVNSGLSTLYENFPRGGTYNHAWNASNKILSQYVAGVKPTDVAWSTYEVTPNLVHMNRLKTKVPSVKGDVLVEVNLTETNFKLELESPNETMAVVGIPKINIDIIDVKVGGQVIWKDNAFVSGVSGVTFDSEDANFLKFKVVPGTWVFNATIKIDRAPEVSFTSPTNNTVIDEGYTNLEVAVNATDNEGVTKVDLFLNNELLGSKTAPPYTWSSENFSKLLNLPIGRYTLKAIAYDTKNKESEDVINIIVRTEGLEIEWVEDEELPDNVATNLIDGDITDDSRWAAKFFPKSVIFDLGKQKNITGTKIWTYQNRAFQYRVEVSDEPLTGFSVVSDQTNNTSKEQPLLADFTNAFGRYVKITVTGVFGTSVPWVSLNEVEITTSDVLSLDDIKSDDTKLSIFPNPSNGVFTIKSKTLLNAKVTIYTLNGSKVFQTKTETNSFSMNEKLKKGIYIVKLEGVDKVSYGKIVIR